MKRYLVLMLIATFALHSASAQNGSVVVVLANSIDDGMAAGLYEKIGQSGFGAVRVNASEFPNYRSARFIVILGGHNSPEGVGGVVGGLLDGGERDSLLESGARFMFRRDGVWSPGQVVWVLAGYGAEDTRQAGAENSGAIQLVVNKSCENASGAVIISSQFVNDTVVVYGNSLGFYVSVRNNGSCTVDGVSLKARTLSGLLLETNPNILRLGPGETQRFLVKVYAPAFGVNESLVLASGSSNITLNVELREAQRLSRPCSMCRR